MSNNGTFKDRYNRLIDTIEDALNSSTQDKDTVKGESIQNTVAKKLYMDNRRVSEIFQFITGKTLGSYVTERKVDIVYQAKISGSKRTWEEAALLLYRDRSSFDKQFKNMFNVPPAKSETEGMSIPLTKPLYFDSIMKEENTVMDYTITISEEEWSDLKNYDVYGSLYDVSFEQIAFAKKYIKMNPHADLEYALYILSENFRDMPKLQFTDRTAAEFMLVIEHGYSRRNAEELVTALLSEGYPDIWSVDSLYLDIMNLVLSNIEIEKEDKATELLQKYPTYDDYRAIKEAMNANGYASYWDTLSVIASADDVDSWTGNIKEYIKLNPAPIKGDWNENEYWAAQSIFDFVPIADILSFASDVYGKERFLDVENRFDALVFAAMYKYGMTEDEAIAFIRDKKPSGRFNEFINSDNTIRIKYESYLEYEVE